VTESGSAAQRPLAGHLVLLASFGAGLTGAVTAARVLGRETPERVSTRDIVTIGLATQKLARLVTKDRVTSSLRAPFTEVQEAAGHGELDERPRGRGLRRAIGELLVCPYCVSQWIVAAFAAGLVIAPAQTRLVAATYTAETIADFTQLAYRAAEDRA
jgi:hypothetical protein